MVLLRLSLLFLFTGPALAAVSAANLFDMIESGDGSCDGQPVDDMVADAITLNDKAIEALTTLSKDKQLSTHGEEGRLGKIAEAMFGVQRDIPILQSLFSSAPKYKFDAEDRAKLSQAKEYFEQVKEKFDSNSKDDGGKMYCGADDWFYAATGADVTSEEIKGLREQGNNLVDSYPVQVYIAKHWSTKDPTDGDRWLIDPGKSIVSNQESGGKPLTGENLCDPPARAQTWKDSKLIMVCDQVFDTPTLADLQQQQASWSSGKSINSLSTAGSELLHEMMHYIDQKITDIDMGGGTPAYEWANCAVVAGSVINQANPGPLRNADNYRMFATAVFFDQVEFDENGNVV